MDVSQGLAGPELANDVRMLHNQILRLASGSYWSAKFASVLAGYNQPGSYELAVIGHVATMDLAMTRFAKRNRLRASKNPRHNVMVVNLSD